MFPLRDIARSRPWVAVSTLLLGISAWLWPIGLGGRMPIGGDVSQFSIGLMAVLGRALKSGRLPLWNDLWGFGFPGLAESQMGVFYPPHLLLYGFLSTETAYTSSLVLHTYWAALGAYWTARCFGVTAWGAALSGFCWAASGVFLIHLPHQWGYTTGSWMPWSIGLACRMTSAPGRTRDVLWLALVLAMQVLPGHFQIAFMTQIAVMGIATWAFFERPRCARGSILVVLAIAIAGGLTAMQLLPTYELARSASSQRSVDYLSAFPSSPVHLIHYLAPQLFHGSPLWRSVAWDPFHAMPEEHQPYVGLVAIFLAACVIHREFRQHREVRVLTILVVGSLLLSLGPYAPGFGILSQLPGFSFFRAPARWSLLTTLGLALLAGRGFDACTSWPRVGRGVVRFVVICSIAMGITVAGVVVALRFGQEPAVKSVFETLMATMPWSGDPPFSRVVASSRVGPTDSLVLSSLIRQGFEPRVASRMTLDQDLLPILMRESFRTIVLLVALILIAPLLVVRKKAGLVSLFLLAFADLLWLAQSRDLETAPIRPLVEQSTVLGRLATLPYGSRTIDPLRNLPMIAGVSPESAYRTLDRPVAAALIHRARSPEPSEQSDAASRLLGTSARVFDLFESRDASETIHDPALASWLYGRWAEANPALARFGIETRKGYATRSWFVPGLRLEETRTDNPDRILSRMRSARPASFRAIDPEHFEVEVEADAPGMLIVSVLDDPGWQVVARPDSKGDPSSKQALPVFGTPGGGAWQAVQIPGPGVWRFGWSFHLASTGIWISLASWTVWMAIMIATFVRGRNRGGSPSN